MEEKDKGEVKEQKPVRSLRYYLVQVLILLAVVALGLYIVNSVMDYRYKVVFIKTPCQLCVDLNKNQSACITNCFNYKVELFPDGFGKWRSSEGKCYGMGGLEINCTN
jgi:hypothetical protein